MGLQEPLSHLLAGLLVKAVEVLQDALPAHEVSFEAILEGGLLYGFVIISTHFLDFSLLTDS